MSLRHTPRQSERDVRLHDPHPAHPHAHSLPPPPPHPLPHPPHMNGNGLPTPPGPLSGPSSHPPIPSQMVVSPPTLSAPQPGNPNLHRLTLADEQTWLLIGRIAEQMGDLEHALSAYEHALRHNPLSLPGLTQVASIARVNENYSKAVDYFQRVIGMQQDNGEVWSALGHCYLMQDDLQKAYAAYQQALYLLPNPKEDPKLWYGIGILYDRYGSLDHAEEAFASVLKMDKDFDKANEILFRLGIIYKQQGKYMESLECFDRILRNPPNPLAHADIWFQIGHVYEQQRDHVRARDAYERVVADNPSHAKVLQQLGWLYHQDGSVFQSQEHAIHYLTKSLEADSTDAQSWYLLGRAYMAGQKYNKAYEAYQQAVYRDGRNPTFWCSIGVLYFQINQYRDALDAYSRAIRINPYISEVWFDLGSLYESCNNQISDAIDAYARAAELDPGNTAITQRLQLLKTAQATGGALPAAPGPQDVHPTAYANPMMPPPGLGGPPMLLQPGGARPLFRTDSRGPPGDLPLPIPQLANRSSPGPFRGGPPPPVVLDENRHLPSHTPLAPMDVDRTPLQAGSYPPPPPRENGPRGPPGQSLLLHHPVPQQQAPPEPLRTPSHAQAHLHETAFSRPRMPLRDLNHSYSREPPMGEPGWDRRMAALEHPDWDRRGRPGAEYSSHAQTQYYASRPHSPPLPPRGASPRGPRERSIDVSPRTVHPAYGRPYWDSRDSKGMSSGPGRSPPRAPHELPHESASRRYDPRYDAREPPRDYDRESVIDSRDGRYATSPDAIRTRPMAHPSQYARASESPRIAPQAVAIEPKERRRRNVKDKDTESSSSVPAADPPKKERKRRATAKRVKEEAPPTPYGSGPNQPPFKVDYRPSKGNVSPEPASSNGSGSAGRSMQPSPTNSTHIPPSRVLDEDYDEGVADTLLEFRSDPRAFGGPGGARVLATSPQMMPRHSTSRSSPPQGTKRPLSPGPDDHGPKRSRMGSINRRVSPQSVSGGRPTPTPSMRPSPIPFHQQPTSHSPETRQPLDARSYPPSPSLPTMLPPHPRPIGAGHTGHGGSVTLPPMASSANVSPGAMEDGRGHSRSASPPRGKRESVLHGTGSPGAKGTPSPSSSNGRVVPVNA
ncbi:TPR-like protein [Amylocystis lapponica]|nr:TPR-like protein [Amylocystis lapponica]